MQLEKLQSRTSFAVEINEVTLNIQTWLKRQSVLVLDNLLQKVQTSHRTQNIFDGSDSSTSMLGCALCLPFVSDPTPHIINQVTRLLIITTTNRQTKKHLFDPHKNYEFLNNF